MKRIIFITGLLLSVNCFANEDLSCKDIQNSNLLYEIKLTKKPDVYSLVVFDNGTAVYSESLKYLDWQGVAEYSGKHTTITIGENPHGYAEVIHSGISLNSTKLNCEINAQINIKDPIEYSLNVAKEYSLGDSNEEGEYSCWYETEEELEMGGDIRIVSCNGTRQVLVFGGHMVQSNFECRFNFEPMPLGSTYWQVTHERCQ